MVGKKGKRVGCGRATRDKGEARRELLGEERSERGKERQTQVEREEWSRETKKEE